MLLYIMFLHNALQSNNKNPAVATCVKSRWCNAALCDLSQSATVRIAHNLKRRLSNTAALQKPGVDINTSECLPRKSFASINYTDTFRHNQFPKANSTLRLSHNDLSLQYIRLWCSINSVSISDTSGVNEKKNEGIVWNWQHTPYLYNQCAHNVSEFLESTAALEKLDFFSMSGMLIYNT